MKGKKPAPRHDRIRVLCRRWTTPREEIFRLLVQRCRQHLSAKEIYVLLQPAGHDIGIATIYRTLDLLDKAGLLRKIQCPGGQVRYQYKRGGQSDHQYHLICTVCGKILGYRDFEKEELDLLGRTEDLLERKSGFLIRDHNIEYFGLCKKCRPDGARLLTEKELSEFAPGRSPAGLKAGPIPGKEIT
jgi:Fur family ferric uptake transcriptional regulator